MPSVIKLGNYVNPYSVIDDGTKGIIWGSSDTDITIKDNVETVENTQDDTSTIVWKARKDLCDIADSKVIDSVRHTVIEMNFFPEASEIRTLGDIQCSKSAEKLSRWQIFKISLSKMQRNGGFRDIAGGIIGALMISIPIYKTIKHMEYTHFPKRYADMEAGRLVMVSTYTGKYIRPFTKWDYYSERTALLIFEFVLSIFALGAIGNFFTAPLSIRKEYKLTKWAFSKDYLVYQPLKSIPKSISTLVACIISIGDTRMKINQAIERMLLKDQKVGSIPHPIEDRVLTFQEEEKFINEVSAFFCISNKQDLLNCWRITLQDMPIENLTEIDRKDRRVSKFLALIPKITAEKYFIEIMEKKVSLPFPLTSAPK
ncbi:MAG: hypothetical protein H0W88_06960 [Parachlamydiaceae bacterium]|nr:hypothetical protein [Parachlamydiaceae bacterium]